MKSSPNTILDDRYLLVSKVNRSIQSRKTPEAVVTFMQGRRAEDWLIYKLVTLPDVENEPTQESSK